MAARASSSSSDDVLSEESDSNALNDGDNYLIINYLT